MHGNIVHKTPVALNGRLVTSLPRSQWASGVAVEIAPRRINVVCPGIIDTPMFGPDEGQREAMLSKATSHHLIDRPGTADEVAAAILFVIENSFVTGTTVDVDGGWMLT